MVVLATVFGMAICCIAAYTGLAIGDEESFQAFGLIWSAAKLGRERATLSGVSGCRVPGNVTSELIKMLRGRVPAVLACGPDSTFSVQSSRRHVPALP